MPAVALRYTPASPARSPFENQPVRPRTWWSRRLQIIQRCLRPFPSAIQFSVDIRHAHKLSWALPLPLACIAISAWPSYISSLSARLHTGNVAVLNSGMLLSRRSHIPIKPASFAYGTYSKQNNGGCNQNFAGRISRWLNQTDEKTCGTVAGNITEYVNRKFNRFESCQTQTNRGGGAHRQQRIEL